MLHPIRIALLLFLASTVAAEERAVQLLLPSQRLQPTSTFEVRFAAEMVRPEQLGKPVAESPLVFEPKLDGQFVWLSTRSGSFAPSATLPLGVKVTISLRQGLRDASGNPIGAQLNETADTPPMRLKGSNVIGLYDSDNATATPRCLLLFNTDVEAAAAAKFIWWEDAGGKRVEAKVEQADGVTDKSQRFYAWSSDDRSLATWSEVARGNEPKEEPESEGDEATPTIPKKVAPRRNVLVVSATKPLPPGEGWRLVLAEGLPSAEWKIGLPERKEVKIGVVQPFVLKSLDAETNRIAGRRLILQFSKSVATKVVTPETLSQWVTITPAVKNLHPDIEDRTVTVKGDFALETPYQVSVKAGLPAAEPIALAESVSRTVTFEKIAPRLYFEDFATHQFAGGTRLFRLLSINVPRIRVTAHLFTGGRVPAAVTAYDHYESRAEAAPSDESYSRVAVEKLGGKIIWERELSPGGAVDSHEVLQLDWNQILGAQRTGAVLLTAESIDPVLGAGKRVGTQAFVQLTDLGAVWKRDSTGMFVHVFSLATGRNLSGVKLRLLDKSEKQLAQTVTDASGNSRLPKRESETDARWVQVTRSDDSHLIAIYNGENDVPLYRLGLPEASLSSEGGEEPEREEVFLFSERGVYKPGDTLHLKGLARVPNDKGARVAAGKRLAITGTDARDREFFHQEVALSEYGSFTQDIPLPDGTLGKYRINAESVAEDESLSGKCTFQVQEYRPNAFEISVPPPPAVSGPAELEFPIVAKYFMGAPLSQAKLTWSLVARDQEFKPEGLEIYAFCEAIENFRLQRALDHTSQFNAQGTVDLGPNGAATVRTQFPINPKAPQPRAAKLLCEITDLNQQTVSQSVDFVRQSSDYYFGLHRFDSVVREGEPLPIELIAVRPDGKPLAEMAKATLQVTRIDWQTNRLDGAGDTAEFESKPVLQVQWEKEVTLAPGPGPDRKPIPVTPDQIVAGKPGEYLLTAIGRDAGGHEIRTALSFEVAGPGSATWDYRNSYAIDVSSDKESYEPGQTATLLVKTPIAGEALVTVEHEHLVRSFTVELAGNAPSIKVPVAEGDAPNVFVSVMILRGGDDSPRKIKTPEYRIGYCQLKVSRPREKLGVLVRTSASAVKPGEKIAIDGEVRDFAGKPVADAEVTLYAVDEGVLSLTAYKTPDALAFFNLLRRLGVQTSLTLPTMLREDAVESDFANKGYLVGDGKGGPAALPTLRTKFIACAYWNGSSRTNAAGQVRAEFTVPDSLTRYRVIAVATTKTSQIGAGESAFEINKPVMLEPALPRFGNVGDKISLRAVVHNQTDLAGDADVEMQLLDKTTRAAESRKRIAVPARGSVAVDFLVEFVSIGQAKWVWQVAFKSSDGKTDFRDSVQSELKIGYPAALVREVTTKRIEQNAAEIARIADPQILEGSGEAKINLANTRTLELHEALKQLLHYPYGCVEQTTSSLLPWLTVRDLRAAFPELVRPDAEVAKAVNHGIDLLLSMQTTSGGLSYWPNGREPTLWGSAYGGLAFALAGKAGFKVPEDNATKLFNYISAQLRGTAEDATGYGLSDRCLAVYSLALAGKAEPAYHELLFKKRDKLSAEDRALVALAVLESHGPASMIDELLRAPIDEDKYVEQWFGSVTREYALNLLAWTRHQPRAPKVDQLATELFSRRSNGHWGTTQGNAWSLLALSSYLRAVEKGDPNSRGEIRWNAAKQPFELSKAHPLASAVFPILPQGAASPITVSKTGGQIFSEATIEARPRLVEQPRQDRGYGIARKYARIDDNGKLSPATGLHVGDRILVTLDLEVRRRATYVVIEDPLPSVYEAINPEFKSQEVAAGETLGSDWISSHQELREDRAVFFADILFPGRYSLRYLARVVAAGNALAPSAKIQEMYHPERFGSTDTEPMIAAPLK